MLILRETFAVPVAFHKSCTVPAPLWEHNMFSICIYTHACNIVYMLNPFDALSNVTQGSLLFLNLYLSIMCLFGYVDHMLYALDPEPFLPMDADL